MTVSSSNYPNPFIFNDSTKKFVPGLWPERAEELLQGYQHDMYGYIRSGENIDYSISDEGAVIVSFFGTKPAEGAMNLTVGVALKDNASRRIEFSVPVFLPDASKVSKPEKGWPFIVCMHPIEPQQYALDHGFAVIILNTTLIAADNSARTGLFYELYPYDREDEKTQTGELAAWGWNASKILDALYAGAAKELGIDPDMSVITGVSRWGKAAAVCGAFDKRFAMVAPSCSGAGGLALYRYISEGKTYDFSSKDAPVDYTYGKNEPLSCLQSDGEQGWFNTHFLTYESPSDIPYEQYELAAICADPKRCYFIIGSCISEDWVNAPAMWLCYRAAQRIFDVLGLSEHIMCNIHKEGHAVIREDMEYLIAYFNKMFYGIEPDKDLSQLKTSVFELEQNHDPLFDELGSDWA